MAVLNEWQKITRVLPGKPFGDGVDGDYNSSTIPTMTYRSCSGTSGNKTLSIASGAYSNGDIILIHQTRGTGVGQWEINQIESGGGTTTLTLKKALQYTYTDSGASQAQCVKIPRYSDVTLPSGTWSIAGWGGNTGGLFPLAANGVFTVSSTISAVGSNASGVTAGSGKGFSGGAGSHGPDNSYGDARQGEGSVGTGSASRNANGNAGGASYKASGDFASGAGGGGHASAGSSGVDASGGGGGSINGLGGSAVGTSDLTSLFFGGGGGGANAYGPGGAGGGGGAVVVVFAKRIAEITGLVTVNGGTGANGLGANGSGGGGGAGGAVLLVCQTATVGTNKVTATGGAGGLKSGGTNGNGGAGSVGRIAVHHSGEVTGTTNPTFTDVEDPTLVESGGNFFAVL